MILTSGRISTVVLKRLIELHEPQDSRFDSSTVHLQKLHHPQKSQATLMNLGIRNGVLSVVRGPYLWKLPSLPLLRKPLNFCVGLLMYKNLTFSPLEGAIFGNSKFPTMIFF